MKAADHRQPQRRGDVHRGESDRTWSGEVNQIDPVGGRLLYEPAHRRKIHPHLAIEGDAESHTFHGDIAGQLETTMLARVDSRTDVSRGVVENGAQRGTNPVDLAEIVVRKDSDVHHAASTRRAAAAWTAAGRATRSNSSDRLNRASLMKWTAAPTNIKGTAGSIIADAIRAA